MNSTPTILKVTGILLLLSCILCIPTQGVADSATARFARARLVEDFEKRMTQEELTRLFEIPATEGDREGFMRRKLIEAVPASSRFSMWLLESFFLGIALLVLGFYESWSRRENAVQGPPQITKIVCGTCGYDMMGLSQGTACPECAGKSA